MRIEFKTFEEINTIELYTLLQLRSEVFVVEQNCVYQDIDGLDKDAVHQLAWFDDRLVGYLRIFKRDKKSDICHIGRVVIRMEDRGKMYAHKLMEAALHYIDMNWKGTSVKVSAQSYLKTFYETYNFIQQGEEYLEDGIPHIAMYRN
jgi:ElaA protein